MKILLDVSTLFTAHGGGVYNYLIKVIPALIEKAAALGDDMSFLRFYCRGSGSARHPALGDRPVHGFRFPVKWLNRLWLTLNMPNMAWFYKGVDVVHAPHFSLPVMSGAKKILTVNDITYLRHPEFFTDAGKRLNDYGYKTLLPANVRRADRIVAISQFTKEDLMDYFGLPDHKVAVVHIGCDRPAMLSEEDRQARLRDLGLDGTAYLYFPVGTLEPRKNIAATVRAFLKAAAGSDMNLVLSGVGDDQWLSGLQGRERLRWVHWRTDEERNALFQGARFVLYPSLYEGFGIPVVEAMGNGKAVLTSNTTSLKEIAVGYAHTIDPEDEDALAEGIERLINDDAYRASLEQLSLQRSRDFTWAGMADKLYAVYQS